MFKEVQEAYVALSNPEQRRQYDMFGHILRRSPFGPGALGVNINLDDLFSGGFESISQECLAVAIRRVLVEEMMFYSDMSYAGAIFNEDEIEISAMLWPQNLKMVPNHLMSNLLNIMDKGESCNKPEWTGPTNGFRLPRLWWAGENHSRAVYRMPRVVPLKNADVTNPNSTGY